MQNNDPLVDFFKGLSNSEKLILALYYVEDLSMKEIAKAVGISEGRVSQMHKSILERLRAKRITD